MWAFRNHRARTRTVETAPKASGQSCVPGTVEASGP